VTAIEVDAAAGTLTFAGNTIACTIGRGGACPADAKREGDGCTPLGSWPVRGVLLRPGRVSAPPRLAIPWRWTRSNDGWSDGIDDPAYNRPVILPHRFSHERLQRDDAAYDIIVVLGHNDAQPVPGMGSAIFWHLLVNDTNGGGKPTEGCVAIARNAMENMLPLLTPSTIMNVR
jgi:L,D-peptidoglycan transpeptidase YkuD (ErfK/YbiS/YcfS/YnhG family)